MAVTERTIIDGKLECSNGQAVTSEKCRFCLHSRYFVINGKQERSPALAFCLRERVTKNIDCTKATAVGCSEEKGDGYANIGNIIS